MWPALLCMVRLVAMEPVLRHLRPRKEDEREKLWEWAGAGGQAGTDHLPVPRSQPGQSGVLSPALLHLHHHTTAVHHRSVHVYTSLVPAISICLYLLRLRGHQGANGILLLQWTAGYQCW